MSYDKHARGANLKKGVESAIQAGEANVLRVASAENHVEQIQKALQMASWLGALGGRSRNGWGSLEIDGDNIEKFSALLQGDPLIQKVSRPLTECLKLDWPHALGTDQNQLLLWRTSEFVSWQKTVAELARIKIAFRTDFKFDKPLSGDLYERHVLAYPVTNHVVKGWGKQARLANSLRFKIMASGDKYQGIAYHMPCGIPDTLHHEKYVAAQQLRIWREVHTQLDNEMERTAGVN